MKILLDTHILLWAISDPGRLPGRWRNEIESPANLIYLSAISVAEIMIKSSIGKLIIQFDPLDMASKSGFDLLDFTAQDAMLLKDMPFHHRDPFDRMLIAQAMHNRLTLVTDDAKFGSYACRLLD